MESFRSVSGRAGWQEFPPGTSRHSGDAFHHLEVSGFSLLPGTFGIWKRLGTWVTDQPHSSTLSQTWVLFSRMKMQGDTNSALGILLCWCCAKI